MPQDTANPTHLDPYKHFRFRVKWDGQYVAGVSKVGGLKQTTQLSTHREGGDPGGTREAPGITAYGAITLERGVTHDSEFERWANKVWDYRNHQAAETESDEVSLKDFRKDILIELANEAGQIVETYMVYRCWVSEYKALPEMDAMGDAVAIQTIVLENEGWDRVVEATGPNEPTITEPS